MIDLFNSAYCPTPEEISEYVRNPAFDSFCLEMKNRYHTDGKPEFSNCSWLPGWNLKFRKSGKSLCTVYPNETYFSVLVVVGKHEKDETEAALPNCSAEMQKIYRQTKEGNGQKWLTVDLTDDDALYRDVLNLIKIKDSKR